MDSMEFVAWLKGNNLFPRVQKTYPLFRRVLKDQLKVRRRDKILLITDTGSPGKRSAPIMAGCYLLAAKRLGLPYRIVVQEPKDASDPVSTELTEAIRNLQEDNFIVGAVSRRVGSFRKMESTFKRLIKQRRHTFVLTTLLSELPNRDFDKLAAAMDIDYNALRRKAKRIKRLIDLGRRIDVITDKGTSLKISVAGMSGYINDGIELTSGGNIPVGEVYVAPRKNMVEGVAVIDGSVRTMAGTILVREPVRIIIKEGNVVKIAGGSEAKALRDSINSVIRKKGSWKTRRIGELGIGLNPGASVCGPNIINEKALGTAHIAIGSNIGFGGIISAPLHLDQVFHRPRIYIDGVLLEV